MKESPNKIIVGLASLLTLSGCSSEQFYSMFGVRPKLSISVPIIESPKVDINYGEFKPAAEEMFSLCKNSPGEVLVANFGTNKGEQMYVVYKAKEGYLNTLTITSYTSYSLTLENRMGELLANKLYSQAEQALKRAQENNQVRYVKICDVGPDGIRPYGLDSIVLMGVQGYTVVSGDRLSNFEQGGNKLYRSLLETPLLDNVIGRNGNPSPSNEKENNLNKPKTNLNHDWQNTGRNYSTSTRRFHHYHRR